MILNGPLRIAAGVLDLRIAKCGIAHTQYAELGRHAIEIQADAIEIRLGRAAMPNGRCRPSAFGM
jgi:hypothetical protein